MTQNALSRLSAERPAGSHNDLLDQTLARIARLEMALASSGGTLHDVNNLLTVLSGNLYLLTESLRGDAAMLGRCRSARDTAQRAAALIRELLTFARTSDDSESSVCPATLLENLQPVLRRSIHDSHTLSVRCDPETWRVSVSVAQLESAVANLVLNANQALDTGGRIEIDVANVPANSMPADALPRRDYVRISVRDNGAGIPADALSRVTQPLFTSKPRGQGSGMGLTMVRRFARSAGGHLAIKSTEGKGTEVTIWLPRASDSAVTANLTMPISTLPSGEESILVAVNDESTAAVIQQLLEALGYRVLVAADRSAACAVLEAAPEIALVIGTDDWLDREEGGTARGGGRKFLKLVNPGDDAAGHGDMSIYLPVSIPELAQAVRRLLDGDGR